MKDEEKRKTTFDYRTFKWKGIHQVQWHGRTVTLYKVEINGEEQTCGAHTFADLMQKWRQAMAEE